jgi:integrase
MAKAMNRLTALSVRAMDKPGRHSDGGGLYLSVSKAGGKSWTFLFQRHGRTREAGLGSVDRLSLKDARDKAAEGRRLLGQGSDPLDHWRRAERAADIPTFRQAADEYFQAHRSEWRNDRHAAEWRRSVEAYCKPLMGLRVNEIETLDVKQALKAVWGANPETASRVRGRIEKVLGACIAAGWISRDKANPARWKDNLAHLLARKPKVRHFAALPYEDAPEFVRQLRERRYSEAGAVVVPMFAFEFLILTACRSNEALGARWDEVDLRAKTWTVPAERTKRLRAHVVPLSAPAIEILQEMADIRCSDLVFPGKRDTWPLGPLTFVNILRRMKVKATAHGFRSSIRDYLGNETATPRDVCEAVLSHQLGDATEVSYRRQDALAKRRIAMDLWADYLAGPPAEAPSREDNVVRLRA